RCEDAFWKHRREAEKTDERRDRCEGENWTDLTPDSVVDSAVSNGPNSKLPSEPSVEDVAAEVATEKEVAAFDKKLDRANAELRRMREQGIGALAAPVAGGGRGVAAIEEAIFNAGPLLPTIC